MKRKLIRLPESKPFFRYGQARKTRPMDSRGSVRSTNQPYGIREGVVGTKGNIRKFKTWVRCSEYMVATKERTSEYERN
jgi:hypothetical protein